jgi:hypothetical protein
MLDVKALAAKLFIMPHRPSAELAARWKAEDAEAVKRLESLGPVPDAEVDLYLAKAQQIVEYETSRKAGAENRATAFIAAVATLIPLMTWALGNTSPICSGTLSCAMWSTFFNIAVFYFVVAAYWALRSLAVANYHTIGVEDLASIKERQVPVQQELLTQTLSVARRNQDTINLKMDFIRTAQSAFFIGLLLLAVLLTLDPWFRFLNGDKGRCEKIQVVEGSGGIQIMPTCSLR